MLAHSLPFLPENDETIFPRIPASAGVFLLRADHEAGEPYVSKSSNLRRRISRLLARPEHAGFSKRLNLRERCAAIEFTQTGSDFENTLALYRELRQRFPQSYGKRLRLAPPALIKLDWENAYPRAHVTTRLGRLGGSSAYFGPFRSRSAAEKCANDVLDLFKSRRCTFELNPDPTFPGCVYSEMKMCMAPCFKGCSDEEYTAEVRRVQDFLVSHGDSLIQPAAADRDRASESLEFEQAKALHERVEKLKAAAHEIGELVHRIDELDCVIVQPGLTPDSAAFFRFHQGRLCGPMMFGGVESKQLMEVIDSLAAQSRTSATESSEHLSILKRWYYRSHKSGEIVFRNADGSWPLRKLMNAVERVSKPQDATK